MMMVILYIVAIVLLVSMTVYTHRTVGDNGSFGYGYYIVMGILIQSLVYGLFNL